MKPFFAFLAVICLLSACAPGPSGPDLARLRAPVDSLPEAWKEEPVVILSDSIRIRLRPGEGGGNEVERRQSTWFYVNRRNPNLLEQFEFPDFENIEGPVSVAATAHYPDGQVWNLPFRSARRMRSGEGETSSNRFLTVFRLPRYVDGMLIRVEETRAYNRPEFLKTELLRSEYPCLRKTLLLSIPPGSDLRIGLADPESLKVDTLRDRDQAGPAYRVSAARLPKLDPRTIPRDPETWLAALHFSLPPRGLRSFTWKELGDEYLASIKASTAMTPEMEKLAASVAGKDPDTLAIRFLSLLRGRLRYHSDPDKLHAFVPRPAGEVLSKGYGDCKEMSTLMAMLLRKKGIRAGMALVSPPGFLQVLEAYPSLGGFNHMVVYIEAPGMPTRFFDPTVKYGGPEDSYFPIIDRTALLLEEGNSRLVKVAADKGFRNRVETRSAIGRDPSGKEWRLEGSIRLDGLCAFNLFPALESAKGDEHIPFLKSYLQEAFGLQASTCRAASHPDRSAITIDFEASFTANYLDLDKGGLLVNQPSLYGGEIRYTALDFEGPRHFTAMEQTDIWQVPAGFGEIKADGLEHDLGQGKWKREGAAVKRTFSGRTAEVAERARAAEFVQRKTRFARATLWHN